MNYAIIYVLFCWKQRNGQRPLPLPLGEVSERSEDGEGTQGGKALSVTCGDSSPRGRAKGLYLHVGTKMERICIDTLHSLFYDRPSSPGALFSESAVTLLLAIIVRGCPHCQCWKNLFLSDFLVLTFFLKALPTVSALILANHPEYLQLSYLRPWRLAMQKRNTCLQKIHLLSVRQSGGIDSHTRPCYTGRNSTTFCKGRVFYGA